MSESINIEVGFFLVSIFCGGMISLVYDGIRIFRRIIKHGGLLVALEDLIFWIGSGVMIFVMMYQQNNGIIRGFSIMGMMLGMIVYSKLFSRFIVKGCTFVIRKGCSFIVQTMALVLKPFLCVFGFAGRKTKKISGFFLRIYKILCKNIVKRLKNLLKTVKITITKD